MSRAGQFNYIIVSTWSLFSFNCRLSFNYKNMDVYLDRYLWVDPLGLQVGSLLPHFYFAKSLAFMEREHDTSITDSMRKPSSNRTEDLQVCVPVYAGSTLHCHPFWISRTNERICVNISVLNLYNFARTVIRCFHSWTADQSTQQNVRRSSNCWPYTSDPQ